MCFACIDLFFRMLIIDIRIKEIKNYSESQWANILPDMSKKSDLTESQESNVSKYIAFKLQN